MIERKEKDIMDKLELLEKHIKELEAELKKEKDLFLDEYLKAQGFK